MANSPRAAKKAPAESSGKFQLDLAARAAPRAAQDTFTCSVPAEPVLPGGEPQTVSPAQFAMSNTAPASTEITILPTDTTEVKLAKLRQIDESADYTGMSYSEIYTAIWNRYNDAFGGKLEAITTCLANGPDEIAINNQYGAEMLKKAYYPMKAAAQKGEYTGPTDLHSEMLGYGGMSWEEKEAAILEKYRGKSTLADFLSMQGELNKTGVLSHKMGGRVGAQQYCVALESQLKQTCFPEEFYAGVSPTQAHFNAIIDRPFDAKTFWSDFKDSLKSMTFSGASFNVEAMISKEIEEFLVAFE